MFISVASVVLQWPSLGGAVTAARIPAGHSSLALGHFPWWGEQGSGKEQLNILCDLLEGCIGICPCTSKFEVINRK